MLFFLARFEKNLVRPLPDAGIHLTVYLRFDSVVIPAATCKICEKVGSAGGEGEALELALFNATGDGFSGYHYDPMFVAGMCDRWKRLFAWRDGEEFPSDLEGFVEWGTFSSDKMETSDGHGDLAGALRRRSEGPRKYQPRGAGAPPHRTPPCAVVYEDYFSSRKE